MAYPYLERTIAVYKKGGNFEGVPGARVTWLSHSDTTGSDGKINLNRKVPANNNADPEYMSTQQVDVTISADGFETLKTRMTCLWQSNSGWSFELETTKPRVVKSGLTGKVRIRSQENKDAYGNMPGIPNAKVFVTWPIWANMPKSSDPVTSDAQGVASFLVPDVDVDASVDHLYADVWVEVEGYVSKSTRFERQTLLHYNPAAVVNDVWLTKTQPDQPVTLRQGYIKVEGRRERKGTPQIFTEISKATVIVTARDYPDSPSQADTNTSGLAEFYCPELPPESGVHVVVTSEGYAKYDAIRMFKELFPASGPKVPTFEIALQSLDNLQEITATVKDGTTKKPIQYAIIYADGTAASYADGSPVKTDENGNATFPIPVGTKKLGAAKTPGYEVPVYTNDVDLNQWKHYDIFLGVQPEPPKVKLVFEFNTQEQAPAGEMHPAAGTQVGAGGSYNGRTYSDNGTVDPKGSLTLTEQFPLGMDIHWEASQPGYEIINVAAHKVTQDSERTDCCIIHVNLKKLEGDDAGQQQDAQQVGPGSPFDDAIDYAGLTADDFESDDEEFIYPNSADGKYFTATQARFYVGDIFVDELFQVQFALQGNRIPIYGYASRDYDAVGTGRALGQGQLAVNFVSEGYMYTLLNEFFRVMQNTPEPGSSEERAKKLVALKGKLEQLQNDQKQGISDIQLSAETMRSMPDGNQGIVDSLPADYGSSSDSLPANLLRDQESRQKEIDKILQQINLLARDKAAVNQARNHIKLKSMRDPQVNAVYLDVPFTIEVQLEGGGRTITRRLEGCLLGANEQVYDHSGAVLLDCYSFIFRRLR